jgi:hypothetical protein
MPIKVKKNKVIKQKQKQSQRQVVNIKIGDVKKSGGRKRVSKKPVARPLVQQSVQPVQYMYQSTGSAPIPQTFPRAVYENIGVTQPTRANILGSVVPERVVTPEVRPIENQLQIGSGSSIRENILGGAIIPPEDIRRQRELRLSPPQEQSLYADFPEEEVDIEPLQLFSEEEFTSGGGAISGGERRRYVRKDGYGTKDDLIYEILFMNIGYTESQLNKLTRKDLINIVDRNTK